MPVSLYPHLSFGKLDSATDSARVGMVGVSFPIVTLLKSAVELGVIVSVYPVTLLVATVAVVEPELNAVMPGVRSKWIELELRLIWRTGSEKSREKSTEAEEEGGVSSAKTGAFNITENRNRNTKNNLYFASFLLPPFGISLL